VLKKKRGRFEEKKERVNDTRIDAFIQTIKTQTQLDTLPEDPELKEDQTFLLDYFNNKKY
jgi:hypothetical protein